MEKEQMVAFWNWFETQKDESYDALIASLNERIKQLSLGLSVELDVTQTPKVLVVTPQGVKHYFTHAYEMVAHAPTVEGWEIVATKPPFGVLEVVEVDGISIEPSEVTFMPLNAPEHPDDLAIRLYHKAYVAQEGREQNAVIAGLYLLLDKLLGEESATFDFQYIDFDDMPHPKEQDYPLMQLPAFMAHKKSTRKIAGEKFPKEEIGLLEGKVEALPTLLVVNNGLKYYEFTKSFPYLLRITLALHNTGDNGLPNGNTDELYGLEDVFYQGISKVQKGHFIATETYNKKREMFYYVDALESIEQVLAKVPETLSSCTLSYEVSYDPFWVMVESYIYM